MKDAIQGILAATSSATNSTSTSSSTTTSPGTNLANVGSSIGSFAGQFAQQVHVAVVGIDGAATLIAFYAGILLVPIGAILFWGRVSRRSGQGLIVGGVILIVLSFTLFPWLPTVAPPP